VPISLSLRTWNTGRNRVSMQFQRSRPWGFSGQLACLWGPDGSSALFPVAYGFGVLLSMLTLLYYEFSNQ